jgi:hypothetical protein
MESLTKEIVEDTEQVVTTFKFYLIKTSDIVYISILYFVFGYYIAKATDYICDTLFGTDYNNLNQFQLIIEIVVQIIISLILSKYCKQIIETIPFPFEGLHGYSHFKLKDLLYGGDIIWSLGLLAYQKSLIQKIKLLKKYFEK